VLVTLAPYIYIHIYIYIHTYIYITRCSLGDQRVRVSLLPAPRLRARGTAGRASAHRRRAGLPHQPRDLTRGTRARERDHAEDGHRGAGVR